MIPITTRAAFGGAILMLVSVLAAADPPAALSSQPYFEMGSRNLVGLLPPPPPAGSAAAAADLAAVLDAQRLARRRGTTARAVADAQTDCGRFADVLGQEFSAARVPLAMRFLNRAAMAVAATSGQSKTYWWRPRPYAVSSRVEALADVAPYAAEYRHGGNSAHFDLTMTSYPSGHATFGMGCAILLAGIVPEQRTALFARGRQYGESRLIVGAHFPTDVESGRVLATVVVAQMQESEAFEHDFALARVELRAALGLPPDPPDLAPKKPAVH